MILLLDVGNSFIKWAWLDPAWLQTEPTDLPELSDSGEVLHVGQDMTEVLTQAWTDLPSPTQVWLANVAGKRLSDSITAWVKQHWQCPLQVAQTQARSGNVVNAYPESARLGIDRWLAMLAANTGFQSASCIIDCGSAITVDALDASGQHMGGLILPGLKMMRDGLYAGAEGLAETPDVAGVSSGLLFADNTTAAVEAGSIYAIIAFIERVVSDMEKELNAGLEGILTGGDAGELLALLSIPLRHKPDLVLQGLAIYANRDQVV